MVEENETIKKVPAAQEIYVLMQNEYRISRNIRAQWFLNNVNKVLTISPKTSQSDCTEEIEIISAKTKQKAETAKEGSSNCVFETHIVPETRVTFLAGRYRLVFCLDLSPSVATVDSQHGNLFLDEIYPTLKRSLEGVCQSFYVPRSNFLFVPQLHITVIAHVPNSQSDVPQVLVQGWILTPNNLAELLAKLQDGMNEVAACVAKTSAKTNDELDRTRLSSDYASSPLISANDGGKVINTSAHIVTADISTLNLLRYGILALQLLPENSSAGIIVITDGVISFPNAQMQDSLLAQLRNSTIACSFLQTGSPYQPFSCFGRNPYTELMQFVAAATCGAYFPSTTDIESDPSKPNAYHEAFLYWRFQTTSMPDFFKEYKPFALNQMYWTVDNPHFYSVSHQSRVRKKHTEGILKVSLENLLSCRLREGYTVKSVTIDEGKNIVEVLLLLPWNLSTNFEFIIKSNLTHANHSVRTGSDSAALSCCYELIVDGCYEFLHDVTCSDKKPIKSYYRTAIIKQFWNYVKSLSHTDQILVQLHSFTQNPAHYTIPESIKNGVPLSYLSTGSAMPVFHSSKSMTHSPFVTFWKPLCMLDINVWQKWMHTHRIGIILQHDMPLPKNLHLPNASGRYVHITCRQAITCLNRLLIEYSSFVLVENHFYIKFLYNESDKPPTSFYVIRVTSKAPCMVIRLAFLGGLPGHERNEIVKDLREKISNLKFPKRKSPKEHHQHLDSSFQSMQSSTYDVNCCFVLKKPVEKILIRYEKVPENFFTSVVDSQLGLRQSHIPHQLTEHVATNMLITLSKYLHHQRWVWSMQSGTNRSLALPIVSKILYVLTKIKLRQGFHFSHSNFGVTYLVMEMPMKASSDSTESENSTDLMPCVIQYLLFPPHTNTMLRDSTSEEEESDLPESDGELQLITECWIEPQYGITSSNSSPSLDGISYEEISHALYKDDWQCISILTTFEHLNLMCQKKESHHPALGLSSISSATNDLMNMLTTADSSVPEAPTSSAPSLMQPRGFCVNLVPYSFSVMNLLPKCHQTELSFPTLYPSYDSNQDEMNVENNVKSNDLLVEHLVKSLSLIQDHELALSTEDCHNFLLHLHHRLCADESDAEFEFPHFVYPVTKATAPSVHQMQDTANCPQCSKLNEILLQTETPSGNWEDSIPKWRCFLKGCSSSLFVISFVPASFSDLQRLVCRRGDTNDADKTDGVEIPPPEEEPCSVQRVPELVDDASANAELNSSAKPPLTLPVYTYASALPSIISQLISLEKNCFERDSSECHSFRYEDNSSPYRTRTEQVEVIFDESRRQDVKRSERSPLKGCHSLIDRAFSKSFVYAVYKSLVLDLPVDKLDVVAAIDEICEESLLEVDITDFIYTICGHIKDFTVKHSVKQQHLASGKDDAESEKQQQSPPTDPSTEKLHPNFPLSLLQRHQPCEQLQQKHLDIKEKFEEILQCFLKKIPSRPDYYIFCPSEDSDEASFTDDSFAEQVEDDLPNDLNFPTDMVLEKDSKSNVGNLEDRGSLNSHMSTQSSLSSLDEDQDSSFLQKKEPSPPLFIHLLCSVRSKQDIKSCSIPSLPTCLNDLLECIHSECSEIDLEEFRITLDITCLTLPSDIENPSVSLDRQYTTSFSSSSPVPDSNLGRSGLEKEDSHSSSESLSETVQGIALRHVPSYQREGVNRCIDKITWLLLDEKAAGALNSYPITSETLDMVINHVRNGKDKTCCIVKEVPLKFVFGPESSVEKFIQVFKRLTLPGYHLNEVDGFYYLALNAESVEKEGQAFGSLEPPLGIASKYLLSEQSLHCDDSTQLIKICDEAQKLERTDEETRSMESSAGPSKQNTISVSTLRGKRKHRQPCQEDDTETEDGIERKFTKTRTSRKSTCRTTKSKPCFYRRLNSVPSLQLSQQSRLLRRCNSLPPNIHQLDVSENDPSEEEQNDPTERKETSAQSTDGGIESVWRHHPELYYHESPERFLENQNQDLPHPSQPWNVPSASSNRSTAKSRATDTTNSPQFFSDLDRTSVSGSCHFSTTEDGYDGDSSDTDSDWDWMSALDTKRPVLPKFWLIMTVDTSKVTMYFHIRHRRNNKDEELVQSRAVLSQTVAVITNICKEVNQTLLLQSLHETRMCNRLLVPEESDDIWKKSELDPVLGMPDYPTSYGEDGNSGSEVQEKYLEANLRFMPGAFNCNVIWTTHFKLHHRLTYVQPGHKSKGIQAFRTVLDTFSVNNRENMFVYQERSGSVFYLRLYERLCDDDHTVNKPKTEGSLSPSGSCCSGAQVLAKKFYPENENELEFRSRVNSGHSDVDRDDGQSAVSSSRGIPRCIGLFVHGIGEVGNEIKVDLVQVLQNRLNDCILDMIIMMLSRNPLCKLTPEDVQFIQNPNQPPFSEIHFTIPVKLLCHAHSIHMYLRQNMLHFLHNPKYTNSRRENHFKAYSSNTSEWIQVDDNDIFLYHSPQASGYSGSKGIACIILSLVTGQGHPFEHLGNSLPSSSAYRDGLSENDFEELTSTYRHVFKKAKTPGPVALIRYQIWSVGKDTIEHMELRLHEAVKHALWDLLMEYRVLTAPVSDSLNEDVSSCSEPTTPVRVRRTGRSTVDHTTKLKEFSSPLGLYSSKEISSSVPDIAAKAQSPQLPRQSGAVFHFTGNAQQQAKIESSPETPHVKIISDSPNSQTQESDKCSLNYMFHTVMKSFLQFGSKLGCPALFTQVFQLPSRHCVSLMLSEVQNIVKSADRDLNFRVFIRMTNVMNADTEFVPFKVNADMPSEGEDVKPGTERSFIIVGRNNKQWNAYMGTADFLHFQESYSDALKNYQRYQTHTCSPSSPDRLLESTPASPTSLGQSHSISALSSPRVKSPGTGPLEISPSQTSTCSVFVPRQRLLLMFIQDKELTVFLYNWSHDITTSFLKQLTKLVEWHESRDSLLNNLVVQKLGLFNGQFFFDQSDKSEKSDKNELGRKQNSSRPLITWKLAEQLFQYASAPREQPNITTSSRSSAITSSAPQVQDIFKNTRPPVPLHLSKHNSMKDPVKMYGIQVQEIRTVHKRGKDMQELRSMWQTRDTSFHNPYVDRLLLLLKRAARLSHYCLTPILFNPSWRWKVAPIRDHTVQPLDAASPGLDKSPSDSSVSASRSRHDSGSSLKNAESNAANSSRSRRASGATTQVQGSPKIRMKNPSEETWHQTVCSHYLMEYMQYLQTLGFVSLQTKESPNNQGVRRSTGNGESKYSKLGGVSLGRTNLGGPFYLIRYQLGGLLLFEVSLSDPYAYAYLYTVECTRLHSDSSNRVFSSQFTSAFLDEVDKIKFMMHLHSFTFDYHLRTIHSYVSGRQLIFRHGYHLTSFLDDFIKYYQKSPNGARNLLYAGTTIITDINMSGDTLYNYIISHNLLYGMTVLRMVPHVQENNLMPTEFVLVELSVRKASYKDSNDVCQMGSFDIGLLINHNTLETGIDHNALVLNYYIILTSQRDLFPKLENFGTTLGSFQTVRFAPSQTSSNFSSRKTSTVSLFADKDRFESSGEETSISSGESRSRRTTSILGITDEEVTYLGYFSSQETMMQEVLKSEARSAQTHLKGVFHRAAINCRRDSLWSALLPRSFKDDENASKDSHTSITYTDFSELLNLVSSVPLDDMDGELRPFLSMHISWYKSLIGVLKTKYADYYREFSCPSDPTVQYVAVTDTQCPDQFMLLSLDMSSKRAELSLVSREESPDKVSHRAAALQYLVEEFVNACCFQLWSSMIT